jgi:hypothetical protein
MAFYGLSIRIPHSVLLRIAFLASTTALVARALQVAIATASLTILPGFHALDQRSLLGR